jgi:hypothetical protein
LHPPFFREHATSSRLEACTATVLAAITHTLCALKSQQVMGPAPIHSLRSLFVHVPLSHHNLDSNVVNTPHIMSNTMDNNIQLAVDGANWATYRDRLQFMLEAQGWSDHLMHENISRTYMDAGMINSQSPMIQWRMHEAAIKQIFSSSIPDSNQICCERQIPLGTSYCIDGGMIQDLCY